MRLQTVEVQEDESRDDIFDRAMEEFNEWFKNEYPESTRQYYNLLPTIPNESNHGPSDVIKKFQVKWREPKSPDDVFVFWIGNDPMNEHVIFAGNGYTKEAAALDFLEKFMMRGDLIITQRLDQ
jgi:hypothetical protein